MTARRILVQVPGAGSTCTFREIQAGDSIDCASLALEKLLQVLDTNGVLILDFVATASAVNFVQVQNNATTFAPRIIFTGSDTNVDGVVATKGSGRLKARYGGTSYEVLSDFLYAAKGDLIAGSGSAAHAVLSVGSNGQALVADSTQATGLKWAAPAPASHASTHQNGGADEVATATAAANAIPKAGSGALLDRAWIPAATPQRYHKAGTTNYTALYMAGLNGGVTQTTLALVANRFYAVPFIAPDRGGTLDLLEVYVTTGVASTNIRLGIYGNTSEAGLYPGSLVLDAGASSSATSSTKISLSISQALTPGALYWLVCLSDGAPTIRAGSANAADPILGSPNSSGTAITTHLYATQTYGALPGTFPGSPTAGQAAFPGLFRRFSA
jgi:hypothetical protein